ncbi:MAG: hypothetical protein LBJ07_03865 [Actinomycetes bacterium]|jgi:hypothetical protein|nr:hypothetical protein [Actinomycetes bacterium]
MFEVKKSGNILIPPGVVPEKHELETASTLAQLGKDIQFLVPSRIKGIRTADILMDGIEWEMKCFFGSSLKTLRKTLKRANKQSHNVILDLRHTKLKMNRCLAVVRHEYLLRVSLKRLIVITKADLQTDTNAIIDLCR